MSRHRRHHRRRRNPLGVSGGVVKDAVYVAAGAIGSAALPGMIAPAYSTGWTGVAATAAAAVGLSFLGRMVGGQPAAEEVLKGGLAAAVIKAMHAAGFGASLGVSGLGLYSPSYFAVPTSSNQYLRSYQGNGASAPVVAAKTVSGMGYHRFRGRYAGNYGG